jgi:hypothetical protein
MPERHAHHAKLEKSMSAVFSGRAALYAAMRWLSGVRYAAAHCRMASVAPSCLSCVSLVNSL